MKKALTYLMFSLLLTGFLILFISSCKKGNENIDDIEIGGIPLLSTSDVTNIAQIKAQSGGIIISDKGYSIIESGVCWNESGAPTIADNKASGMTGFGSFKRELTGLTSGTTYYVRAYATNSYGTGYGNTITFNTLGNTFTDDRDGNVYKIVTIGNQLWMAENLKYLPSVVGPGTNSATVPYYYVYGYDGTNVADAKATANYTTYGVLYNWTAAMNGAESSSANPSGVQGVCPSGWHVPSDAEWTELTDYLGGLGIAGGKLKETGITHWDTPNTGATNETGFSALPGGNYYMNVMNGYDGFYSIGSQGGWWSATMYESFLVWSRYMISQDSFVIRSEGHPGAGFSVRCVRD